MDLRLFQFTEHQRRMTGFVIAAIIIHGLVLMRFHQKDSRLQPKLPDWMNIKLVAGIDDSSQENQIRSQVGTTSKPEPINNSKASNQVNEDKAIPEKQSQAQNFIKTDSQPYEHENPKPFYPAAARRRGMEGTVLLQVEVDMRGKVSHIELKKSSGFRLLDNAAISTVSQWRFIPAREGDRAVRSQVDVPVRFVLSKFKPDD